MKKYEKMIARKVNKAKIVGLTTIRIWDKNMLSHFLCSSLYSTNHNLLCVIIIIIFFIIKKLKYKIKKHHTCDKL